MPGGMQWMDLERQRVNANRSLQAGHDEARNGMYVKEHARFETQLHDVRPLAQAKIDLLALDRESGSLGVDHFDSDWQADCTRTILALRLGTG